MPEHEASRLTFFGLFALQHRGQESAGIATSNGKDINVHSDMGLVTQIFREEDFYPLSGELAIGHTRYSTTGSSNISNAQPILSTGPNIELALGHNGNVVNAKELKEELLEREKVNFRMESFVGNRVCRDKCTPPSGRCFNLSC